MRALFFAVLIAGCSDYVNPCDVDLQILTDTGTGMLTDCGTFNAGSDNYSDAAMLAAQKCVVNAIANKQTFRLSYDAQNTDGMLLPGTRAGWEGIYDPANDRMTLRVFAGRGGGDMASKNDLVSVQQCDSVEFANNCTPVVGVPCLTCAKSATTPIATVSCRG